MSDSRPVVSVVIPCRNERDYIEDCVRSVLGQEGVPGGFEVIVVDGISDDGTREILSQLCTIDERLRVIDNPARITPCAMNVGILESRGEYIAIMGAHNVYAPDYLRSCVEVSDETAADNVGGSMRCVWGQITGSEVPLLQRAIAVSHHVPFAVGGARWHDADYEGYADTVFGGFYRREVFERVGLFDESLVRNQDDELNLRLTRAGGKIWHSPRIRSWKYHRGTLSNLLLQYTQAGYWKVRVIQKHRIPASMRHIIPGFFLFCLLLFGFTAPWSTIAFWSAVAMTGSYATASLLASLLAAARNDWRLFPLFPIVFGCYHIGYGYGFLRGVVDFVILRRQPPEMYTKLSRISRDGCFKSLRRQRLIRE
jgi:glycosyltransferase involved in cell wall biosynthesis